LAKNLQVRDCIRAHLHSNFAGLLSAEPYLTAQQNIESQMAMTIQDNVGLLVETDLLVV
jgi:hypothetical protein